jgi:hypothetical protein
MLPCMIVPEDRARDRTAISGTRFTRWRELSRNPRRSGGIYGDALISVACPAVANGAASRSGIENAVRRSLRSGWAKEDGPVLENSEQPTQASLLLGTNPVHWNAKVTGRFQLIAGDIAETARIDGQGIAQHEFHAEVCDHRERRVGMAVWNQCGR